MSGRFVRASKFRHVHGDIPKQEELFSELRPQTTGESNYIAANGKYFSIGLQGGGGPLLIHPLDKPQRFPATFPTINVHKGKVLDMDFSPFNQQMIATASDDGTAKVTLFPEGGLTENIHTAAAELMGHQKRVGHVKFHPAAANVLMTGSYDTTVKTWDIEAQAEMTSFEEHGDLIQCLSYNSNGSRVISTCKDKKVRLFDTRQTGATLTVDGFPGAKSSRAVFMDNHNMVCLTGFTRQNTRALWFMDPRNMSEHVHEIDLDQAAGVLMPFYDPDTSILYVGGKGDGNIRYFEIEDAAPHVHHLSDFRSSTPHKGICFTPKAAVDYMGCEVSFCLRLLRNAVEPIHFKVPRKSQLFQADLFPDTACSKPSMTAQEWMDGADRDLEMVTIQAAKEMIGNAPAAEFVAKKSPQELEQELNEALARVKELEGELATLRGQ